MLAQKPAAVQITTTADVTVTPEPAHVPDPTDGPALKRDQLLEEVDTILDAGN